MSPTGPPTSAPTAAWPSVLPIMAPLPAPKPKPISPPFSQFVRGAEQPPLPISKIATSEAAITLVFIFIFVPPRILNCPKAKFLRSLLSFLLFAHQSGRTPVMRRPTLQIEAFARQIAHSSGASSAKPLPSAGTFQHAG